MPKLFLCRCLIFLGAAWFCGVSALAQVERPEMARRVELVNVNDAGQRFELGQRLRAVEAAWDANTDAAARKRATFLLKGAVAKFFGAQPGEAARALDNARFMLQSGDATPAKLWAESLYLKPESRLLDAAGVVGLVVHIPVRLGSGLRATHRTGRACAASHHRRAG